MANKRKLFLFNEAASKLNENMLPTKKDVVKAVFFGKKLENIQFKSAVKEVTNDVLKIWEKSSIPTVSGRRISTLVNNLIEVYRALMKCEAIRQKTSSFKVKAEKFLVNIFVIRK